MLGDVRQQRHEFREVRLGIGAAEIARGGLQDVFAMRHETRAQPLELAEALLERRAAQAQRGRALRVEHPEDVGSERGRQRTGRHGRSALRIGHSLPLVRTVFFAPFLDGAAADFLRIG